MRDYRDVPEGWELKKLPSGKYARVMQGVDPTTLLAKFKTVPLEVLRLRPSNRAWRRKSPHVTLNANINDLTYWKQEGFLDGGDQYGVSNTSGTWNFSSPDDPYFPGTAIGRIWVQGFAPRSVYDTLGLPYLDSFETGAAVEPMSLLETYASEIDDLSHLALNRHFKKLQNQKIDLATETAQAMQTVNMIADIAKRLATAFLALKKLDVVKAFQALFPTSRKELANDYLVYQYGIKPLLGDIVGAAEHLAEYVLRARPVKSNGHAQKTFTFEEPLVSISTTGFTRVKQKITTVKIRVKYGSVFQISDDLARQAAQLGVTNPANVVWELVPFSFVADWFLPIGDFLSSLTSLNGLTIKESYKTVFIEHTEYLVDAWVYEDSSVINPSGEHPTFTESIDPVYGSYTFQNPGPYGSGYLFHLSHLENQSVKTVFCKREVIPLPEVPLPRFKSPVSLVHVEEALALITQLRGK